MVGLVYLQKICLANLSRKLITSCSGTSRKLDKYKKVTHLDLLIDKYLYVLKYSLDNVWTKYVDKYCFQILSKFSLSK